MKKRQGWKHYGCGKNFDEVKNFGATSPPTFFLNKSGATQKALDLSRLKNAWQTIVQHTPLP